VTCTPWLALCLIPSLPYSLRFRFQLTAAPALRPNIQNTVIFFADVGGLAETTTPCFSISGFRGLRPAPGFGKRNLSLEETARPARRNRVAEQDQAFVAYASSPTIAEQFHRPACCPVFLRHPLPALPQST
jgi:hypothetical protein